MTMPFTENTYTNKTEILKFPDHSVQKAITFPKGTIGTPGLSTLVNGRYTVKAGTVYPSDDEAAEGIVLYDVDVHDGDGAGAIVVHGFIDSNKLPAEPDPLAVGAMAGITFIPALTKSFDVDSVTIGDLADLDTTDKTSIVDAINEVDADATAALGRVVANQAACAASDIAGVNTWLGTFRTNLIAAGLMVAD